MVSLPAMFFGDRFCVSRTGGGGWVSLNVANSMAVSELSLERPWLALCGLFLSSIA